MEEQKKLYIGNLNFDTTENDLRALFQEKGIEVKDVKIITDKYSGRSKGFGFAEFETEELAQKAIDALNEQEFAGRKLTVNKARKMQPRTDKFSGGGRGSDFGGGRRY